MDNVVPGTTLPGVPDTLDSDLDAALTLLRKHLVPPMTRKLAYQKLPNRTAVYQ